MSLPKCFRFDSEIIAGLCMSPTAFIGMLLLARTGGDLWFLMGLPILCLMYPRIYRKLVVDAKEGLPFKLVIYFLLIFIQLAFFYIVSKFL